MPELQDFRNRIGPGLPQLWAENNLVRRHKTSTAKKYQLYKSNDLVGEYTAAEIAEKLKCSLSTVRSYAKGPRYLYGKYRFEAVKTEKIQKKPKTMSLKLEKDWERTRQQMLHSEADLSRIILVPEMPNRIYMQITQDALELPTAIADSPKELSEITGAKHQSVITIASKARHGRKVHPSFISVDVEKDE